MTKKRREVILSNRVSRMVSYSLGGYEQKVLLDGRDENSPIILPLHGGPGIPIPFSAGCRGMFPEYTNRFIMAYWDQLGCGINNYPIDDGFTVDSFVDMTVDLVKALKVEFPNNRLILLGTSWGSVLSAKTAAMLPQLVDGVLVYGQVLTGLLFTGEVYEALSKARMPMKSLKRLSEIWEAQTHTPDDIKDVSAYIRRYTEGYQAKGGEKMRIGGLLKGLLSSPDYSLKDCLAIIKNGFLKNSSIFDELLRIDLRETIGIIRVPYRILQGSTDIVTSTKAVSEFLSACENNWLSFRVIENNGHMPSPSGMDEIYNESLKLIKILN